MEEFPDIPDPHASMEYLEFNELMENLDEKYRAILILYYVEGFKIHEIAELLDLRENTVKTRLARGRKSLAAEYEMKKTEIRYYKGGDTYAQKLL